MYQYRFEYDAADRVTKKAYSTGTELEYKYDRDNIINKMSLKSDISSFNTTDEFKQQGRLTNSKTILNNIAINRNLWYDNIGRFEGVNTSQVEPNQGGIQSRFTYVDVPDTNKTSTLVRSVAWKKSTNSGADTWENLGISYEYEYDENYNITKVLENDVEKVSFVYDAQNQLERENNALIGKTIEYTYDFGGNILNKKEYAYTIGKPGEVQSEITYAYSDENWKDKLTNFNGEEITYDEIGNPLTYRGGLTMTWTEDRKLEEISKTGLDVSFEYGFDGVRCKKTVNGEVTEFITDGITILAQKTGDRVLSFLTDGNGDTYGFALNDVPHFYLKNVQGDIVGITDAVGNIEARYIYDSCGKLISITDSEGVDVTENSEHIGYINPLRYRGYYYDQETGLYYLNARYYDPETGRFINADSTLSGGLNLFAYCYNNPVNLYDPDGHKVWLIHGTFSNTGTWNSESGQENFISYISEIFGGEEVEVFEWSGGNNDKARKIAAQELFKKIQACHDANHNEPVRLIGHSHGGNVAILAANLLAKETGRQVDTLITIATPVREYQLKVHVGQHLHAYIKVI